MKVGIDSLAVTRGTRNALSSRSQLSRFQEKCLWVFDARRRRATFALFSFSNGGVWARQRTIRASGART